MNIPHKPTNKLVDKYVEKSKKEKQFYMTDGAISNLMQKFPENKIFEDILLKVTVINSLYSTNIFGIMKVAEHILELNLDSSLFKGEPDVVHQIAQGHGISKPKGNGDRNFYSFASKYCSWHNPDKYPIYDSYVSSILNEYRKGYQDFQFEPEELKNYTKFKQIVENFKSHFSLRHPVKEIDKFLWLYGQEHSLLIGKDSRQARRPA